LRCDWLGLSHQRLAALRRRSECLLCADLDTCCYCWMDCCPVPRVLSHGVVSPCLTVSDCQPTVSDSVYGHMPRQAYRASE
jgi:hypothetical protein